MAATTTLPMAILRVNYALMRYPLRLVDETAVSRLDEAAPLRLTYQGLMADMDKVAARMFGDEDAEARADAVRKHTRTVEAKRAASRRQLERSLILQGQQRMDRYRKFRRV